MKLAAAAACSPTTTASFGAERSSFGPPSGSVTSQAIAVRKHAQRAPVADVDVGHDPNDVRSVVAEAPRSDTTSPRDSSNVSAPMIGGGRTPAGKPTDNGCSIGQRAVIVASKMPAADRTSLKSVVGSQDSVAARSATANADSAIANRRLRAWCPGPTPAAARRSDRAWRRGAPGSSRSRRRSRRRCANASTMACGETTVGQLIERGQSARRRRCRRAMPTIAAEQAQHHRLDQELHQHVAAAGAHRQAEADLPGALGDRHQHDVHDADAAHHERDRRRCWPAAPSSSCRRG